MTSQQFLEHTKRYPRNEVERAEAAILVNGERPVRPDELRRFRLLVWMELEGRLLRNRPTHVRAS